MFARKKIHAGLMLMAGISLLLMALPRLRASINQIPVDNFFVSINDQQLPQIEKIPRYIELTKKSISLHQSASYWQDKAYLLFDQAQINGSIGEQSRALLNLAQDAGRQSLALSPGNAYLSYQLAVMAALTQKKPSEIIKLLLMSIMTSPNEPGFIVQRLDFCLKYFASVPAQNYPHLADQVLLLMQHSQRQQLIALLQKRKIYIANIKVLLSDKHPQVWQELLTTMQND